MLYLTHPPSSSTSPHFTLLLSDPSGHMPRLIPEALEVVFGFTWISSLLIRPRDPLKPPKVLMAEYVATWALMSVLFSPWALFAILFPVARNEPKFTFARMVGSQVLVIGYILWVIVCVIRQEDWATREENLPRTPYTVQADSFYTDFKCVLDPPASPSLVELKLDSEAQEWDEKVGEFVVVQMD
ncbi:beta-lactamase family protein [Pseudohyphozyma bogoriensis]|nr:beta-lactamase family protein [Pseudohyphozyma bogoriensis]